MNSFRLSLDRAAPSPSLLRALGILVVLAVAAAIIYHCIALEWVWLRSPVLTGAALALKRRDVPDWELLMGGVRQARGFRDTLSWWHTTWVWPYGYWRPLSALAFWLEYRAYGEHFNDWFATLIVSHLAFCACLMWFAYSLTKRWRVAILSVVIFAAPRPFLLTAHDWLPGYGSQVPGDVILDYWKNNVEAWLGIVVLLALIAAVQRRYSPAFALAGLSVCFKETGWLTFPLIVMVAAVVGRGGIRGIPLRAWLVAALVAAPLAAIKIWVGGHMLKSGPNFTSNGAWQHRYLSQIDGFGIGYFTTLSWPTALLGLAITLIGVCARRIGLLKLVAAIIGAIVLCVLAQSALLRVSPAVSLVMLLDPSLSLVPTLQLAFYFTMAYLALRNRAAHRLLGLLFAAFCLESTIVIVNPKQTAHIYYIPSALCAVLLSVAFAAAWDSLLGRRASSGASDAVGSAGAGGLSVGASGALDGLGR